jgi:hypothetical protein
LRLAHSLDHLVGDAQQERYSGIVRPKRLGGGEVDGKIEFGGLPTGISAGLAPRRNLVDVIDSVPE